jgi:hypothetical protein
MLTFAASFWLVFWTVIGGGALLTVLACALIATLPWRGHGRKPADLAMVNPPPAYGYQATRHSEAA